MARELQAKRTHRYWITFFETIALLFYIGSYFSLTPEAVAHLESPLSLHYFPGHVAIYTYLGFLCVFGFVHIICAWRAASSDIDNFSEGFTNPILEEKRLTEGSPLLFEVPYVRAAYVFPACLILLGVSTIMIPFLPTLDPAYPLAFSLIGVVILFLWVGLMTAPRTQNHHMSLMEKVIIQGFFNFVTGWECMLLGFYILWKIRFDVVADFSDKLAAVNGSPVPTGVHEITVVQTLIIVFIYTFPSAMVAPGIYFCSYTLTFPAAIFCFGLTFWRPDLFIHGIMGAVIALIIWLICIFYDVLYQDHRMETKFLAQDLREEEDLDNQL